LTPAEVSVCAYFAERFDFVELVAKDYPFPRGLASPDIATERMLADQDLSSVNCYQLTRIRT